MFSRYSLPEQEQYNSFLFSTIRKATWILGLMYAFGTLIIGCQPRKSNVPASASKPLAGKKIKVLGEGKNSLPKSLSGMKITIVEYSKEQVKQTPFLDLSVSSNLVNPMIRTNHTANSVLLPEIPKGQMAAFQILFFADGKLGKSTIRELEMRDHIQRFFVLIEIRAAKSGGGAVAMVIVGPQSFCNDIGTGLRPEVMASIREATNPTLKAIAK